MKCTFENCERNAEIKGMCRNCYQKWRYKNDKKYRENKKESAKEYAQRYRAKKMIENVHYDRDKSRRYRKKNKDRYTYVLAKHYWKKLTPEQREKLIEELGIKNMFV
jgi:catalase